MMKMKSFNKPMFTKVLMTLTIIALIAASIFIGSNYTMAAALPLKISVNGVVVSFPDAQPFADSNHRTVAPVTVIGKALGADYSWNEKTSALTLTGRDRTIVMVMGQRRITVNGTDIAMDTEAKLVRGRVFIPVKYIAEAFGGTVKMNSATNTVEITLEGFTPSNAAGSSGSGTPTSAGSAGSRISAGDNYNLVILDDGSLWGWGYDMDCRLGTHYTGPEFILSPTKIMDDAKSVTAGWGTGLVIKNDNTLWAWGYNIPNPLNENRLTYSLNPVKIMDDVVCAAAGYWNVLAVKRDGSLWAWGNNNEVRQDDSKKIDGILLPVVKPIKLMDGVKKVSVLNHVCFILKNDGTLLTYGYAYNTLSHFGDGKPTTINGRAYNIFATDVRDFSYGDFIIKNDGSLWGFGESAYDLAGVEYSEYTHQNKPLKIMNDVKAAIGYIGFGSPLVLKNDGSLVTWGTESALKFDFGMTDADIASSTSKAGNVRMLVLMNNVKGASASSNQCLAIKEDGSVWTWGGNSYGGLGDGKSDSKTQFVTKEFVKLEFSENTGRLFTYADQPSQSFKDWLDGKVADGSIPEYDSQYKADWTGKWTVNFSQYGFLEMRQTGNIVYGYDWLECKYFRGEINGNKLKGDFGDGIFELTMQPDGNSFTGLSFGNSYIEPHEWSGTRKDE